MSKLPKPGPSLLGCSAKNIPLWAHTMTVSTMVISILCQQHQFVQIFASHGHNNGYQPWLCIHLYRSLLRMSFHLRTRWQLDTLIQVPQASLHFGLTVNDWPRAATVQFRCKGPWSARNKQHMLLWNVKLKDAALQI